jgi:hypothetical protein
MSEARRSNTLTDQRLKRYSGTAFSMSWIMDTYSQQVGYPVLEIVTSKLVVLDGPSAGLPEPGSLILVIIGYAARVFRRRYHSKFLCLTPGKPLRAVSGRPSPVIADLRRRVGLTTQSGGSY